MSDVPQALEKKREDFRVPSQCRSFGERRPQFDGLGKQRPNSYRHFPAVVCVEACRTPYGSFGGALRGFDAPQLGALALKECLRRTEGRVTPAEVDYVIMGQVVTAGCGQVPSRQASLLAGIPESVPSLTLNKVCSSGMKALDLGVQMIMTGRADIILAGGQESMSNCPYLLPDMRWGARMDVPNGRVRDAMVYDGLWDIFYDRHMVLHGSEAADEFGFTRQDLDEWACLSQGRAWEAMDKGKLAPELFPVIVKRAKETFIFDRDEGIKPATTLESLAKLPPVFGHRSAITGQPGSITAGNAASINDGASVCLLMTVGEAQRRGLTPLFTLCDYAEVSQPVKDIATVPGLAIAKVLAQNNLSIEDVDLLEINEAFASVVLISACSILGMSRAELMRKVNVNGSAIAYGHPVGATGARIAMTMAYELRRRGGGVGICGICSGFAQGDAMLITC